MSLIVEAALSAPIQRLLDKLTHSDLLNWARSQDRLYHNLQQWEHMFTYIHALLNDAENKHLTDSEVERWLNRLRDLTYDVEDILDEFPPTCSSRTVDSDTVKEITFRLQGIKRQISALGLEHCSRGERRPYNIREGRETSSLEDDESLVKGRELDKAKLLELLQLSPASTSISTPLPSCNFGMEGHKSDGPTPFKIPPVAPAGKKLLVIPIVGMGGMGKTTLARLVYNDDQVKNSFNPRVWVCVSESFNVKELTKIILQKVGEKPDDLKELDLDSLQQKLKEKLHGKKFLMVFDDVWSRDKKEWDSLCRPLKAAASLRGRIIVTTRDHGVASLSHSLSSKPIAGSTFPSYNLKGLSEADCISLLAQHALGANDFKLRPQLQLSGQQIARKCKGSPLAAKTLGGLLQDKLKPEEWEDVLKSNIWDLPEEESGILPALRLSFHHLPSSLKQCFAYFSIFPKDYEFKMEELILLWMAEGFLEQQNGTRSMEDLGKQYFKDLVSRSLLEPSSNYKSSYVMHDLTHDLAQFVAGETCFRLEDGLQGSNTCKINDKVRHCSYVCGKLEVTKIFDPFLGKKCQRTLLALPISSGFQFSFVAEELNSSLLPQFRWLRVLGLSGYNISELPDSVGELKQLRYLNLSSTAIIYLPESVGGLHKLQSLILDKCTKLSRLPRGMKSLTNLRHLSMDSTLNLKEMPVGLGSLKGLQNLSKFIVGEENGLGIQELEHLSDLHGGLLISGLENVIDVQEAARAKLKEKQHLRELELEWSHYIIRMDHLLVIESLQPHTNIETLEITQYGGSKFPSWMVDSSFSNIVTIKLYNCYKCEFLPSLGRLLSLENLEIRGLNQVRRVGVEFYGNSSSSIKPFPSLKSFSFHDMKNWEEWNGVDGDIFSCLRELSIIECPKLVEVSPLSLPSLHELYLQDCKEVVFRSLRDLTSVTSLTINHISELVCLRDDFNQQLESLETLEILECGELRCLWKKTEDHHHKGLTNLRRIVIQSCFDLEYFGAEEREEGHLAPCDRPLVELSALEELQIDDCHRFVSFAGIRCPSLRHLDVTHCYVWEGLPNGAMPKTLTRLVIKHCDKLEALPDGIMNPCSLEVLRLRNCESIKHFPPGELPVSLKTLCIVKCPQMESISERKMMPNNICLEELKIKKSRYLKSLPECTLVNLTKLQIFRCEGVESFWEGDFLAPNLKHLSLKHCKNLRCITDQIQNLTSLQYLVIEGCKGLERFPKEGFPATLLMLFISNCKNVKQQISEWGLHKLTSLEHFTIQGVCPDTVSFGDDFTLPLFLSSLYIFDFPNLDSFSPRLSQSLASLKYLRLQDCPKLQFFPEELLSLPQFFGLEIKNCPNLKQPCQKEKGEYWSYQKEKGESWSYFFVLPEVKMSGFDSESSYEDLEFPDEDSESSHEYESAYREDLSDSESSDEDSESSHEYESAYREDLSDSESSDEDSESSHEYTSDSREDLDDTREDVEDMALELSELNIERRK